MRSNMRFLAVSALALLIAIPALAQTPEVSPFPVTEPIDVGGTILQPGNYVIRVVPSTMDRNKIQVLSPDLQTVYVTALTVPHDLEPGEEIPNTTFVYFPATDTSPRALRTWFAPDSVTRGGHDIVYVEGRARELARVGQSRVVWYPAETEVAEFDTTNLQVITPEATIETYTPPTITTNLNTTMTSATPTTIVDREPLDMPATASNIPLIAFLGLLSIVGAVALSLIRVD